MCHFPANFSRHARKSADLPRSRTRRDIENIASEQRSEQIPVSEQTTEQEVNSSVVDTDKQPGFKDTFLEQARSFMNEVAPTIGNPLGLSEQLLAKDCKHPGDVVVENVNNTFEAAGALPPSWFIKPEPTERLFAIPLINGGEFFLRESKFEEFVKEFEQGTSRSCVDQVVVSMLDSWFRMITTHGDPANFVRISWVDVR